MVPLPRIPRRRVQLWKGSTLPGRTHSCNRLVSGSFHPPSGVLFSFPSPYFFAIGLETYLVLEVDGSRIPAPKLGYGTLGYRPNSTRLTPTGLSPSTADRSRSLQLRRGGGGRAHNTTSPMGFPIGFGLDSPPFARRYSGDPCWFLFLPLLRCFRSGGSRSLTGAPRALLEPMAGGPIQASPDLRLHAPTRGLSQLATPFFGAQAEPSTRRRRRVGSTRIQRLFDVGPMRGVHRESKLSLHPSPLNLLLRGCMLKGNISARF